MSDRRDDLVKDLELVREKLREVIRGGVSVSVSGGVSVSQPSLSELRKHESHLLRQLYLLDNGAMRTSPDFAGEGGDYTLPTS